MSQFDTLGLIFENPEADGIASPPMARIYLQTFTTSTPAGFKEPVECLTPFEYNIHVFDNQADALIENIQRLKVEARRRFAAAEKIPFSVRLANK